ncbi:MAG: hypothetical protein KC620_07220 [Myxococcales bacterium]|nr:hypothetical protein [Myxococcales bacterium]
MRVQCVHCEADNEVEGLAAVEGGFGFACATCARVSVLAPIAASTPAPTPAPAAAKTSTPPPRATPPPDERPPPGQIECPKCSLWQPERTRACRRCGLVFAFAATGRARLPGDPLAGHPLAERLRAEWTRLRENLDDEEGHRAFVRLCAENDALEFAGQCYRRTHGLHDEDPRIAAHRQKVMVAAMSRVGRLEQRATEETRARVRQLIMLTVAAFILAAFAFGYYLLTRYQVLRQHDG